MNKKLPGAIVKIVVSELTETRKAQKISHEKLAAMTGMHRSAISLIEAGKRQPTLLTCLKIAIALNTDLGLLVQMAQEQAH